MPWFLWCFVAFAAFSAGLFEEGGRWLAFRYLFRPAERHWRSSLMLGAGHGGLESIGIGLTVLLSLIGYVVLVFGGLEQVQSEVLVKARDSYAAMQGWEPLLGAWERLCTLPIHIALSVMVVRSFAYGARWWWLALGAHTFVDFTAVGTLQLAKSAWGKQTGMIAAELFVTVLACIAVWLIVRLRDKEAPVELIAAVDVAEPQRGAAGSNAVSE